MVGYHNENHKKINGLRYINESPQYLSGYSIIPFEPLDPFANKTITDFCQKTVIKLKNIIKLFIFQIYLNLIEMLNII